MHIHVFEYLKKVFSTIRPRMYEKIPFSKERQLTFASALKRVENIWGDTEGYQGHMISNSKG